MKDDGIIRQLHTRYCSLTGLNLALNMPKIYAWDIWLNRGWAMVDLETVIAHLRRTITPKERLIRYFQFRNLIERPDDFEATLAEARAITRVPRFDPGKADVLRGTNRPDKPEPSKPKTAEQVMKESAGLKALLDLRDKL